MIRFTLPVLVSINQLNSYTVIRVTVDLLVYIVNANLCPLYKFYLMLRLNYYTISLSLLVHLKVREPEWAITTKSVCGIPPR